MDDYSDKISKAIDVLIDNAIAADARVLESVNDKLTEMVAGEDKQAIIDFFKTDVEGIKLYLEKGVLPKTVSGKRFVALYETLTKLVAVIQGGEAAQLVSFLDDMDINPAVKSQLIASSLFMSPTIKPRILNEWLSNRSNGIQLSRRIWNFNQLSQDALFDFIASGVAAGKNPKQLAPLLRHKLQSQSKYNIDRLLVTETRRVWQDVQRQAVGEFKHIKYVRFKLSRLHKVKDVCDTWVAKGNIEYSKAPDMPLHPQSRTILQPVPTPKAEWLRDMGY